jgi:uncharacterized protein YbjT (DUF2867 family)
MIVITTPTGQIGSQVLGNLLDSGEGLRAIVRDASALPADVRRCLDIVEGSHSDAAVVDRAFSGADAVFWLAPPDPRASSVEAAFIGFTRPAAEAFRRHRHRVGRVVAVSALGRGTPWADQAGYVTGSLAMDDLIAASGVAYRALTNPLVHGQHGPPGRVDQGSSRRSRATASYRPSRRGTSLPRPRACSSTQAGAASARFRCSDPRICRSTRWPRSSRKSSGKTCASSRPRSRPTRRGS